MDGDEAAVALAAPASAGNGTGASTDATPGSSTKRKRSESAEPPPAASAPAAKTVKTHSGGGGGGGGGGSSSSHLQINYLARQYSDVLPLVSSDDSMNMVLQLLSDYSGVLERHESLASNLGARPLGPILIQRFERLFDGQPRVLKSHGKELGTVTWLDVVEFARQKPEQFNLEKTRDGIRVCQFYTKQCRVEISEDDFTLIASGLPQKLIPPQPISEDEEKELGTLEIMEKRITSLIQLADQVSARARQTKHRITSRRNAIASRREAEQLAEKARMGAEGDTSPTDTSFRAVNSSRPEKLNGLYAAQNSRSYTGATASPTTHAELLSCFSNSRQRINEGSEFASPTSARPSGTAGGSTKPKVKSLNEGIDYAGILLSSASPGPVPNTPSTAPNQQQRAPQTERYDDSGPFKAEMLSRMENMARGERVMPPCDRCRRLHMDCLKNLTACLGCTKKHAKCSWKEVNDQELADNPFPYPRKPGTEVSAHPNGIAGDTLSNGAIMSGAADDDPSQPVRDEELLGEDDSDEEPQPSSANPVAPPTAISTKREMEEPPSSAISSPREAPASAVLSEHSSDGQTKPATSTIETNATTEEVSPASPVPPMPKEKVEQAAIQILEKRMEERGGDLAGAISGGFRSVNRPAPAESVAKAEEGDVSNGVVAKSSVAV